MKRTKEQKKIDLELNSKVCTKCGERKDLSKFSRDNSAEDNTRSVCKSCVRDDTSKYTKRNGEEFEYDICTQTKSCARCGLRKPFSEFWNLSTARDGKAYKCIKCDTDSRYEYYKRNRNKHQTLSRLVSIKKLYKIDDKALMEMMNNQNGCCLICSYTLIEGTGATNDTYHIDHNHDTGEVRGLLCQRCNVMLGSAKDSPSILRKGIEYLLEKGYYGKD